MTATATLSVRDELTQVLAGLTEDQLTVAAPFFKDVAEAAQADKLGDMDRNEFRKGFNLKRLLNPTITELSGVELPPKDKPLADRIAEGNYDWWNRDITADRFPITRGAGPDPLFLAYFGVDVSSEEVEEWAQSNGYEVANNDDLLAVGSHEKHKKLQREFPIICLGSSAVLDGGRRVPCLGRWSDERKLDLHDYGLRWHGFCRFLLVGPPSPEASEGHSK